MLALGFHPGLDNQMVLPIDCRVKLICKVRERIRISDGPCWCCRVQEEERDTERATPAGEGGAIWKVRGGVAIHGRGDGMLDERSTVNGEKIGRVAAPWEGKRGALQMGRR